MERLMDVSEAEEIRNDHTIRSYRLRIERGSPELRPHSLARELVIFLKYLLRNHTLPININTPHSARHVRLELNAVGFEFIDQVSPLGPGEKTRHVRRTLPVHRKNWGSINHNGEKGQRTRRQIPSAGGARAAQMKTDP
ncbi:hypothetical protein EVAR_11579_1 [Eumeta japonica]|uniref:Uncharacterized protein n=1 Tax=Eumeta variegata TaxID=151549 RepID=A0A4C1X7G3_EUMVA|nr:hypothetical protein EVAR_11579_1 [Eumeta japonica]